MKRARFVAVWLTSAALPNWASALESKPTAADAAWQRLQNERIAFDLAGEPVVTVGLASEVESLELGCPKGCRLSADDGSASVAPKSALVVRADAVQVGKTIPVAYVEALPYGRQEEVTAVKDGWAKRGYVVGAQDVGMIFGMGGRVFDNRRTQIFVELPGVANARSDERAARTTDALDRLRAQGVAQPWVSQRVQHPATGRLTVQIGKRRFQSAAGSLLLEAPLGAALSARIKGQERQYSARLLVALLPSGKLALAARLPLESLLRGIVPKEIPPSAPLEALKAQAVTARGEALAKLATRHLDDPFTLCSEVHCQVYGGDDARTAATDAAVDATSGEVMMREGELIDAVYSANCGGSSENNEIVWPGPPQPMLRGRLDDDTGEAELLGSDKALERFLREPSGTYCETVSETLHSPYRWTAQLSASEIADRVRPHKDIGEVLDVLVDKRGPNGRVQVLKIIGTNDSFVIERELPVRRLLTLKSGLFVIKKDSKESYTFIGGGFGHGVGMCQIGAIGRARAGHNYRQILKHYYGGPSTLGGASSPLQIQSLHH